MHHRIGDLLDGVVELAVDYGRLGDRERSSDSAAVRTGLDELRIALVARVRGLSRDPRHRSGHQREQTNIGNYSFLAND